MADIEIGIFKSGRRAYGFDDIAIVPSRRTRDPEDVDICWEIDAYRFDLPLMAAAMDGVVSPRPPSRSDSSAAWPYSTSRDSGPATRTPTSLFDEIRELADDKATRPDATDVRRAGPARARHRAHPRDQAAGVTTAASVTPQRTDPSPPPSWPPSSTSWSSRARSSRPSTCPRRASRST